MLLVGGRGRVAGGGLGAGDPDALIEEARQRARRRRGAAVVALLVLTGALGGWLASRGGRATVIRQTASTPFANARGFSGHGELAFVSRGVVWVMDGGAGTLRRLPVPGGFTPSTPTFSTDGRWLAYFVYRANPDGEDHGEVWLARGDGTVARMIAGPNVDQLVGWSPTVDLLAITTHQREPFPPYPAVTRLILIAPPVSRRTLVHLFPSHARSGSINSATWSPDGLHIAVSTFGIGGVATVDSYPVTGGPPTTWFHIRSDQSFPVRICSRCGGAKEVIADLARWWPRWGIGFWVYCCGGDRNLDGSPLVLLAHPGARPRVLSHTLSSGVTDALAAGAHGRLAIVADGPNAGREIGQGKTVENCNAATQTCTPLPGATTWIGPNHQGCVIPRLAPSQCVGFIVAPTGYPGSGISLDPSWSPGATRLAYIRAPIALTGGWPDAAWYAAHALYVWNAQTNTTQRIAAINGANVPTWSSDGRNLLYVHDDGLWLAPLDGGTPTEIAYPLFPPSGLYTGFSHDYYGQIPWNDQFNWWTP